MKDMQLAGTGRRFRQSDMLGSYAIQNATDGSVCPPKLDLPRRHRQFHLDDARLPDGPHQLEFW